MKHVINRFFIVTSALFSLSFATYSLAEDLLTSTLEEEKDSLMYVKLNMEHVLKASRGLDGSLKQEPLLRLIPTIGTKVFRETFDLSVEGYFDRKSETTAVQQSDQARVNIRLNPINFGEYFKVEPYVVHKLAALGKDSSTKVGSTQSASYAFYTDFGDFEPEASVEIGTVMHARPQMVDYAVDRKLTDKEREDLGLYEEVGVVKGPLKHQNIYHEWSLGVNYMPLTSENISMSVKTTFANDHVPTYKIDKDAVVSNEYKMVQSTSVRVRLSYYVNENLTLRNDFSTFQQGFYAARQDQKDNFVNEVQAIYSLN